MPSKVPALDEVGYEFRKQFKDSKQLKDGWYDGKVVSIKPPSETVDGYDRRCVYFYSPIPYFEDLRLIDLEELAKLDPNINSKVVASSINKEKIKKRSTKVTTQSKRLTMNNHNHKEAQQTNGIIVRDNDVLSGRGSGIAGHYGNIRFRALIATRADENFCEGYSASEKKAVAEEIVNHIASLNSPGRFLKRDGSSKAYPWYELSYKEVS